MKRPVSENRPVGDIAIVGYGLRLPGAPDPDAFWSVLTEGRCTISTLPPDRFGLDRFGHPDLAAPGKSYTWAAGVLDDVFGFDPGFFGISPREATQMDPQQRLMLQVAWEALETAGIRPSALAGTETGVFVGASSLDYSNAIHFDPAVADAQMMTGNTLSIVSNRLSYVLDLKGPSFTVDTACSSSLIAFHEAVEALRSGRIETAIVGGVNVLLHPAPFIGFSRASMLSPTGLCRAFDAGGDGYVRSEGAVAVVLRRRDVAEAAGNAVEALVAGSGVNADGRTVGLSLPSVDAQAALLSRVYEGADLDPARLAFVEAHGTGTRVGDPAEANAIGRVLGKGRSAPLPLGSVKTNFGHLEPASGLVGVLKAVFALRNDLLPASLHCDTPNPDIPFDALGIEVARAARPLARGAEARLAGVSSFGFGGANAHVVLADPPVPAAASTGPAPAAPLVLSAASEEALRALAGRMAGLIDGARDPADRAAITATAAWRRDRLRHRLVLPGDGGDAADVLGRFAAGEAAPECVSGRAPEGAGGVVFVFSGNGAQWRGMGREAYAGDPVFREAFDGAADAFARRAGWSLAEALQDDGERFDLSRTEVAQPLMFALQVALVTALGRIGVAPAATVGHSVGEVAAAWASGALSLEDAVAVIHARSSRQETTRGSGGMTAALCSAADVEALMAAHPALSLAAVNSPRSVTLAGPVAALDAFEADARRRRIATRRLDLAYPFHCGLSDPVREPLLADLAGLAPRAPRIPMVSTVTGERIDGDAVDAEYWWRNVRNPVRFLSAIETLLGNGHRVFLEIGPRPVLTGYVTDAARARAEDVAVVPSLVEARRGGQPPRLPATIACDVVAHGGAVEEERLFGPPPALPAPLPTYPWQNRTFRLPATPERVNQIQPLDHPLLGGRLRDDHLTFHAEIDAARFPWLLDHKVEDAAIFPAAGFVEILLAAGRALHPDAPLELAGFEILQPMPIEEGATREIRTIVTPDGHATIESRPRLTDEDWLFHARGRVRADVGARPDVGAPADATDPATLDAAAVYDVARRFGLDYGPAFRRVEAVTITGPLTAVARLAADEPPGTVETAGYHLDPRVLDGALHGLFALLDRAAAAPEGHAVLPARAKRLRLLRPGAASDVASVQLAVAGASPRVVDADLVLLDADDAPIAAVEGMRFRIVDLRRADGRADVGYRVGRAPLPRLAAPAPADIPDLAAVAEAAGVTAGEPVEPSDAALLVDIAARTAIADGLADIVPGEGEVPASTEAAAAAGRLAANAEPLAERLLAALAAADLAERDEAGRWRLAARSGRPALDDLLATLAAEAPDRIAEIATLAAAPDLLARMLRTGAPADLRAALGGGLHDHLRLATPAATALADAAVATVEAYAAAWPAENGTLSVCLLADGAGTLARRVAARLDPDRVRLVVAAADETTLEASRIAVDAAWIDRCLLADLPRIMRPAGLDLVVAAGALARLDAGQLSAVERALAPSGALVGFEPLPSSFADLVGALSGGDALARPDATALRTEANWRAHLAVTGFREVATRPLATAAVDAAMITGHRGGGTAAAGDAAPATDARRARRFRLAFEGDAGTLALAEATARAIAAAGLGPVESADAPVPAMTGPAEAEAPAEAETDILFAWAPPPNGAFHAAGALAAQLERLSRLIAACGETSRVVVVTRGGLGADGPGEAGQAALAGFLRVARNEYPDARILTLDVAPAASPETAAEAIVRELDAPEDEREAEPEIVVRGLRRHGGRIERDPLPRAADAAPAAGTDRVPRLSLAARGSVDHLRWEAVPAPAPGPGEVAIAVDAAGLNFRDVMWTLGLLPVDALEDGFAGPTLGMECAGRVLAVGEGASRFRAGERVVAFAPAALSGRVVVDEAAVMALPEDVPPEAAATIPVAFLTAWYALDTLARLEPGETVLVHGGAGGVGLAALQIALARGARVIATAGSPAKRALLSRFGASAVFDSRDFGFADAVMRATDGEGVDVVLNSLAGEAMERSLATLKPFGRFLELGKRDFIADTRIGLEPFRRNLSYFGIDADQLVGHRPDLARRILDALAGLFADGTLAPLPYRRFEADAVGEAFRLMQQSGHVGKIVIAPPAAAPAAPAPARFAADPAGTYLVTGGTGGFGFAAARWLAENGARHLVLASRSGVRDPAVETAIAELAESGVSVRVARLDVTDPAAVRALLAEIDAGPAPLKGVLHAAMVLDDALMANLDAARHEAVLAPKATGADILDMVTADRPLDLFLLFSSVTTVIGNPGQANYVAANAYLEGLARRRRAAGRPALAVSFGAIADLGVVARDDESGVVRERMARHAMTSAEALDAVGRLLSNGRMHAGDPVGVVARVDWPAARKDLALLATPLYDRLREALADDAAAAGATDLAETIAAMGEEEAFRHVADLLAREISRILKLPMQQIEVGTPLARLGMDSLMAVELRMAAEQRLGIDIPLMSLAGGATIADIARKVVARLRGDRAEADALDGFVGEISKSHVAAGAEEADPDLIRSALGVLEDRAGGAGGAR